jgi:hypothetical protein
MHVVIQTALALTLATALSACAVPLDNYGGQSRYPNSRGSRSNAQAFDYGYRDGYDAGRDDARDRDRYEPRDERLYRSGDHGYDRRYGSLGSYRNQYRDGFVSGYDDGYRAARSRSSRRR